MATLSRRDREKAKAKKERMRRDAMECPLSQADDGFGEDSDDPARQRPARPSRYGIKTLAETVETEKVMEVVLYCRTSTKNQPVKPQLKGATRRIRDMGVNVVARFGKKSEKGNTLNPADRPSLVMARDAARKRGCLLVIPCMSRGVRGRMYDAGFNPDAKPTVQEFEAFLAFLGDVRLTPIHDPDADPPSDESFLRQLAAEANRRKVGNPKMKEPGYSKERRERCQNPARHMHADGKSLREIAFWVLNETGYPITAAGVGKWFKKNL